jgi:hypothetical protein
MKCREALRQIGPYMDGELPEAESARLREHLKDCPDCARRLSLLSGIKRELSSLPDIQPTPGEKYRLINRVRGEMASPSPSKPAYRGVRVAAVAISFLAAVTIGLTWAMWDGGTPTTQIETTQPGEEITFDTLGPESSDTYNLVAAASLTQPSLVVSDKEYDPGKLATFRGDLGTRLDFYSSYWYPATAGGAGAEGLARIQEQLTEDLANQAEAAGRNPDELEKAIATALAQAGDETFLPCYAELARVGGQETWLISLSGPEDYLLFPDPQLPQAMHLASRGGEVSLRISESLLQELAGVLAPYHTGLSYRWAAEENAAVRDQTLGQETTNATPSPEVADRSAEEALTPQQKREFQAFLRQIASQGNNLDLVSALEGLNYEQLFLLVQGDWRALAADGVDLTDFIVPPKRLWAIDCASGAVIWKP